MNCGYRYLAATVAIGVTGAVFIALAYPYRAIMTLFSVLLLLPFVIFLYLGVLELIWGNRLGGGGGPERGEELVPATDVLVEFAGNTHPLGLHRLEELPTGPQRKAA
jgi:hypothetical protein